MIKILIILSFVLSANSWATETTLHNRLKLIFIDFKNISNLGTLNYQCPSEGHNTSVTLRYSNYYQPYKLVLLNSLSLEENKIIERSLNDLLKKSSPRNTKKSIVRKMKIYGLNEIQSSEVYNRILFNSPDVVLIRSSGGTSFIQVAGQLVGLEIDRGNFRFPDVSRRGRVNLLPLKVVISDVIRNY